MGSWFRPQDPRSEIDTVLSVVLIRRSEARDIYKKKEDEGKTFRKRAKVLNFDSGEDVETWATETCVAVAR